MKNMMDHEIYKYFKNLNLGYFESDNSFYINLEDIKVPIPKRILEDFIRNCNECIQDARNIVEKAKLITK